MNQPLVFDRHSRRAVLGPISLFASIVATAFALSGCALGDGPTGLDPAVRAAEDGICRSSRSTIGYTERVIPDGASLVAQCLPLALVPNVDFMVPCFAIEALSVGSANAASCNACTGAGRQPVTDYQAPLIAQIQAENASANLDCFCNIEQIHPDIQSNFEQTPCQYDPAESPVDENGDPVDGFCYVAPNDGLGTPDLIEACPAEKEQILRFVGAGVPDPSSIVYLTCVGSSNMSAPPDCGSD